MNNLVEINDSKTNNVVVHCICAYDEFDVIWLTSSNTKNVDEDLISENDRQCY